MLDGFSLGTYVPTPLPASVWRIVTFLALRGPTTRAKIAGTLWPEATEAHAQGRLRTAVWRLQRDHPGLIETRPGILSLAESVWVDVHDVMRVAHEILLPDEERVPADFPLLLRDAELMPGWDDEWIVFERERLRQLRLHALEVLAQRLTAQRRFGAALEAALAALGSDPLRESAHRVMISVHLAQGNLCEARRQYEECASILGAELGVAPSPLTRRLLHDFDLGDVDVRTGQKRLQDVTP
ncbi:AfsR/SARP family transcriptional regulator [Carbonactinospora thermoautotrophica]|uniref:AfsR/SARP family transcriptional regulator n=1 Tax=Carbonactinospora thermoautotrophica TaxID=1469144 RepID=UPI00099E9DD2|nr:BTAD domain-containing putative transcriptional regulator [Carbonactinospora thermoautotrophica]